VAAHGPDGVVCGLVQSVVRIGACDGWAIIKAWIRMDGISGYLLINAYFTTISIYQMALGHYLVLQRQGVAPIAV